MRSLRLLHCLIYTLELEKWRLRHVMRRRVKNQTSLVVSIVLLSLCISELITGCPHLCWYTSRELS